MAAKRSTRRVQGELLQPVVATIEFDWVRVSGLSVGERYAALWMVAELDVLSATAGVILGKVLFHDAGQGCTLGAREMVKGTFLRSRMGVDNALAELTAKGFLLAKNRGRRRAPTRFACLPVPVYERAKTYFSQSSSGLSQRPLGNLSGLSQRPLSGLSQRPLNHKGNHKEVPLPIPVEVPGIVGGGSGLFSIATWEPPETDRQGLTDDEVQFLLNEKLRPWADANLNTRTGAAMLKAWRRFRSEPDNLAPLAHAKHATAERRRREAEIAAAADRRMEETKRKGLEKLNRLLTESGREPLKRGSA